jgi:hypothetical protein
MMHYVLPLLMLVGVVLLVIGYRRNSRNLLAIAAVCLFVGVGTDEVASFKRGFTRGLSDGWHAGDTK